ncbi:MAG: hypothetical protein QW267_07130 [Sulfolobales archaeon]
MSQLRFESEEKVDYGYVINRQLDRIATVRSNVFKSMEGDVSKYVPYSRLLDYISALESLHALLIPELKDNVRTMLSLAKSLAFSYYKCAEEKEGSYKYSKEKEGSDSCKEFEDALMKVIEKYGLQSRKNLSIYAVFELCDKALEIMIKNLNDAGLLMRGKTIKLGAVKG